MQSNSPTAYKIKFIFNPIYLCKYFKPNIQETHYRKILNFKNSKAQNLGSNKQ